MGFYNTKKMLTDKQISILIKSELIEKTSSKEIDAILIFESAKTESFLLNQTFDKVQAIFGEITNRNVLVVIKSVQKEDEHQINERIHA